MGCFATFPGVNYIQRATYQAIRGFIPGVATLECLPQATLPNDIGNLVLGDDLNSVTIFDCLVDGTSVVRNTTGMIVRVRIKDSRWRLGFATITGSYNVRLNDGSIDPSTERTPQQLLTMLLTAMGIGGTDVSSVPNSIRPEVDWEADPAWKAATILMNAVGCEYIPSFDGSGVGSIEILNTGAALPTDGFTQSYTTSVSLNEYPDNIQAITERDVWQAMFKLKPMAVETDGTWVDLEDASYKPDQGWIKENPENVLPTASSEIHGVASRSVYKAYQISAFAPNTLVLPNRNLLEGFGNPSNALGSDGDYYKNLSNNSVWFKFDGAWQLTSDLVELAYIEQALPLLRKLVQEDGEEYGYAKRFPFVTGIFLNGNGMENLRNAEWDMSDARFDLDLENGRVVFEDPMAVKVDGGFAPADIYLTAAFHIRSLDRTQFHRFGVTRNLASNGTPTKSRKIRGLRRVFIAQYDEDTQTGSSDNTAEVLSQIQAELDSWEYEYGTMTAKYGGYMGIRPIAMSGQISTVKWIVDHERGANTLAAQNTESNIFSYTRAERYNLAFQADRSESSQRLRRKQRSGD